MKVKEKILILFFLISLFHFISEYLKEASENMQHLLFCYILHTKIDQQGKQYHHQLKSSFFGHFSMALLIFFMGEKVIYIPI